MWHIAGNICFESFTKNIFEQSWPEEVNIPEIAGPLDTLKTALNFERQKKFHAWNLREVKLACTHEVKQSHLQKCFKNSHEENQMFMFNLNYIET